MTLYLDIETLPAPATAEAQLREVYERKRSKSGSFADYIRGTSLSGNWGRILCIGIARDEEPATILTGEEADLLQSFWAVAKDADLLVGHNALDFDLPFIYKRSIIHRVKPTKTLSFERHQAAPIFDTMRVWDQWSTPATGLDQLARILGFESSKQNIDGSQVYDYFLAGRTEEIYSYCLRDVELTRAIHRRLIFADREDTP